MPPEDASTADDANARANRKEIEASQARERAAESNMEFSLAILFFFGSAGPRPESIRLACAWTNRNGTDAPPTGTT